MIQQIKELTQDSPINYSKTLDEVEACQQRRKIATLKEGVKRALWFCDSFGIDLLSVVFKSKAGRLVTLSYDNSTADNSTGSSTSNDDNLVLMILYLLDRFGVSDEILS